MNIVTKYKLLFLYLAVFTLPMYMRLNNIFLAIFLLISLVDILFYIRPLPVRNIVSKGWPVYLFFALAVLATLHSFDMSSFKYLEKYWSFLLVPIAILSDKELYNQKRNNIFKALVFGSVCTLLICYGATIYDMISKGEPFEYLFRWRHTGNRFTAITDSHPTYLGIFVITSIFFLIQEKSIVRPLKFAFYIILILGLFQLASRTALLLLVIFLIFLIINRTRGYKLGIISLLLGIVLSFSLLIIIGSQYMEDRIFSIEAVTDSKRVERWSVSYEIFKENPLAGVGYKEVIEQRKEKYIKRDLPISAETEYNAHNQFLEYLSTNGALGGFIYVIALTYLLLLSIARQDALFTFIFLIFILANLTESMMVRIKGIEFFAIFATLFLCGNFSRPKEDEHLRHA